MTTPGGYSCTSESKVTGGQRDEHARWSCDESLSIIDDGGDDSSSSSSSCRS